MGKALRRRLGVAAVAAVALTPLVGVGSAAAVDYSLPSLWQAYQGDFTIGTFGNWNSQQALYHYRSNSLPNQLKLDSQIGTSSNNSLSRQAYVAAVAQINADTTLDPQAKAAAIEQANEQIVLQPTTGANQAEGILQSIEAYNAANHLPEDQKKIVRAHVLAWHGGQQPNWFFCNGFVYDAANPDWASPDTMLKRLDNYIHLMMDKYAKYSDIIVSWDVVNEAVDDYSGQIRNAQDPQVSQWGRIFRRPDLDGDPDARLYRGIGVGAPGVRLGPQVVQRRRRALEALLQRLPGLGQALRAEDEPDHQDAQADPRRGQHRRLRHAGPARVGVSIDRAAQEADRGRAHGRRRDLDHRVRHPLGLRAQPGLRPVPAHAPGDRGRRQ